MLVRSFSKLDQNWNKSLTAEHELLVSKCWILKKNVGGLPYPWLTSRSQRGFKFSSFQMSPKFQIVWPCFKRGFTIFKISAQDHAKHHTNTTLLSSPSFIYVWSGSSSSSYTLSGFILGAGTGGLTRKADGTGGGGTTGWQLRGGKIFSPPRTPATQNEGHR